MIILIYLLYDLRSQVSRFATSERLRQADRWKTVKLKLEVDNGCCTTSRISFDSRFVAAGRALFGIRLRVPLLWQRGWQRTVAIDTGTHGSWRAGDEPWSGATSTLPDTLQGRRMSSNVPVVVLRSWKQAEQKKRHHIYMLKLSDPLYK